ncbi:DNA-binding response regulator [Paenibacillus dendritiformis]|uniref:response regulator transcription factor n=1 Tax=Paenibacillus dendritiformis TaxID=130049 RepID=UPI001B0E857D|nr:response regulator [Paenibacillus dendritiformis]GIO75336.1 DNA-binding response regulator [Paenibacillus dendritiformis]
MLTILIADDQQEEREGIAFLIEELQFPLKVELAENGKKALEFLRRQSADILFTDVKMPLMDGLQLAGQALQLRPQMKVILFSGFAEFEYAKTAISLGVSDYLLKPIDVDAFQETMHKVIEDITIQKQEDEASKMRKAYVKKHVLFTLVNGVGAPPSLKGASLDLPAAYDRMLLLEFEKNFFEHAGAGFEGYVLSLLETPADYINLNGYQSLLLFPEAKCSSGLSYRDMAQRIHERILTTFNSVCYIALYESPTAMEALPAGLDQLEQLMEHRFFSPDRFIFEEQDDNLYASEETAQSDSAILDKIRANIKNRDLFSLKANTEILYQKYAKQVQFSQLYVKYLFSSLCQELVTQLMADMPERDLNHGIEKIYRAEDIRDIQKIINEYVLRLEDKYANSEASCNREIAYITKYIEDHYGDDLSLDSLAAKVYLSPHYLSSMFKKTMGCGLNKYIKNVRMRKAKELLTSTHLKVSDISSAVGYRDVSYFCQNYRDFYGRTPEKYRQFMAAGGRA